MIKKMSVTLEDIMTGKTKYYLSDYHCYYNKLINVTLKLMQKYKGYIYLSNIERDRYEMLPKCVIHFPNGLVIEFGELSGALGFSDRFEVFVHCCIPKNGVEIPRSNWINTRFSHTSKHHTYFEISNLDIKLEEYDKFYNTYGVYLESFDISTSSCVIKPMQLESFADFIASFDERTFKLEKNYLYNLFEIMMGKSRDIRKFRRLVAASRGESFAEGTDTYLEAKDVVFAC